jgi:hypothetical protein
MAHGRNGGLFFHFNKAQQTCSAYSSLAHVVIPLHLHLQQQTLAASPSKSIHNVPVKLEK